MGRWLLVAAILALGGGRGQAMVVVEEGTPGGRLAVGSGAGGLAALAVADLQRVLEKMSGARLAQVQPSPQGRASEQGAVLAVGRPEDFPGAGVGSLGKDEIALRARGGTLYVLGGSEQAISDAVYTLLDRLGCRWYLPGEIGEVIPRQATVRVDELDLRYTPAFSWRHPWCAYGFRGEYGSAAAGQRWGDWYRRNRCGGDYVSMGHSLLSALPPERYLGPHPEYYSLVGGKRQPSQPCTSNPDLVPIYGEAICRYFEQNPGAPAYSLSPEDNDHFCECAVCQALDGGQRDPGHANKVVVTDRLVKFFNQVSELVRQRYPDKFVTFYAYFNHTLPPTTVKLGPGVGVGLAAQQFCSIHGVHDRGCKSRQRMRTILAGYAAQTPHLYIREYDPAPWTAGLPYPLYFVHAGELRLYREMGVRGFSIEAHKAWASTFPNLYYYARGMWDPSFDEQAALEELCRDLYGPAAAPMERYYRLLAEAFARSPVHPGWGLKEYHLVWSADQVAALGQAVAAAEQMARGADAQVQERVLYVRLEYNYLADYLAFVRHAETGDLDRGLPAAQRMLRTIETQYRLNEDLCLRPECVKRIERLILDLRHRAQATSQAPGGGPWCTARG